MAETAAAAKRKVEVLGSEEELAAALAKYVADLSDKFVRERGLFTVVLSGGYLIDLLRYSPHFPKLSKTHSPVFGTTPAIFRRTLAVFSADIAGLYRLLQADLKIARNSNLLEYRVRFIW